MLSSKNINKNLKKQIQTPSPNLLIFMAKSIVKNREVVVKLWNSELFLTKQDQIPIGKTHHHFVSFFNTDLCMKITLILQMWRGYVTLTEWLPGEVRCSGRALISLQFDKVASVFILYQNNLGRRLKMVTTM